MIIGTGIGMVAFGLIGGASEWAPTGMVVGSVAGLCLSAFFKD